MTEQRAERLWGVLSDEGGARVTAELERHGPTDVDMLVDLGGLHAASRGPLANGSLTNESQNAVTGRHGERHGIREIPAKHDLPDTGRYGLSWRSENQRF